MLLDRKKQTWIATTVRKIYRVRSIVFLLEGFMMYNERPCHGEKEQTC